MEEAGLYIHIPFCVKKCNYCDFLSFPADDSLKADYTEKLIGELAYRAALLKGTRISSVFIGGGTPSVVSEWLISDILEAVSRYYSLSESAEVTVECNPSSVLRHKFAIYRKSGVNRLSIGLQSADNAELKLLGRTHTFEEFLRSYQSARMEAFDNINIDLINCFPMQSLKTWKKTLRTVCMLKPEHISVYNLIIEEGTPFYSMREKGLLLMPTENEQAEIDSYTKECLSRYGFKRYEISNYAKPGHECRHNRGYWTGTPYLGFGLNASSYLGGCRWKNNSDIKRYLSLKFDTAAGILKDPPVSCNPSGTDGNSGLYDILTSQETENILHGEPERLTRDDAMEEFIYLGLRLTEGISETKFKTVFSLTIDDVFGEPLKKYTDNGLILREGDNIRLSERGMDVSNVILSDFLLH